MPSNESHYSVALELAQMIARSEKKVTQDTAREYFLELYAQCRRVVYSGDRPSDALNFGTPNQRKATMSW